MDKIFLEDLQIDTVIGIYDWEREIRQLISLDLEMVSDISRAARSDRVDDTLDYKQVAKRLIRYVSNSRFELIETLIERVAQLILYEFEVAEVKVRLHKPGAVRYSKTVGIEITRHRQPTTMQDIYISAGSNMEAETRIRSALAMLENEFGTLRCSTVYKNPAVGFAGTDFLNLVIGCRSALPVLEIVNRLDWIEKAHGRDRRLPKFSPRTLDLDLLLYGDAVLEQEPYKIPRADILDYAFVLGPLAELAPELLHPLTHKTMAELWEDFSGPRQLEKVSLEQGSR
jgi:2-amino-4-hydroxy-6-hydroxymethyldihydropteridine diphosphokinase